MLLPRPSPLQRSHPGTCPSYTRSVFEGRFEILRPSVRGTPWYPWVQFLCSIFFMVTSFVFSKFSDELLLRKRLLRKKVLRKRFFTAQIRVCGH